MRPGSDSAIQVAEEEETEEGTRIVAVIWAKGSRQEDGWKRR